MDALFVLYMIIKISRPFTQTFADNILQIKACTYNVSWSSHVVWGPYSNIFSMKMYNKNTVPCFVIYSATLKLYSLLYIHCILNLKIIPEFNSEF